MVKHLLYSRLPELSHIRAGANVVRDLDSLIIRRVENRSTSELRDKEYRSSTFSSPWHALHYCDHQYRHFIEF